MIHLLGIELLFFDKKYIKRSDYAKDKQPHVPPNTWFHYLRDEFDEDKS